MLESTNLRMTEKKDMFLCHERFDVCTLRRYVFASAFGMYSMHGVERL